VVTDEEALARLETLMAEQKPAVSPWSPVTDYSFEARRQIEGEHPDRIIQAFGVGDVLDYGCGPDAILVRLLRERGVMAYGIDAILNDQWRCFQPRYDTHNETWAAAADVVICREVLEHLTFQAIVDTVRRLCEWSKRFVYVTTRFAKDPDHFLDVDTSDGLDPTHITMMTPGLLRLLFVLQGFQRRADLEQIVDWQNKGRCLVYERA
jgi:hypothetical protein